MTANVIQERRARPPKQAGFVSVERTRKTLKQGCPACLTSLEGVHMSHGRHTVVFEECPRCGLFVLDDGELETLVALAASALGRPAPPEGRPSRPGDRFADGVDDVLAAALDARDG